MTPHLHNFLLGLRMEPCIDEMKRSCCGHASSQHLPHPAPSLVPRLGHLRNQRPCVITFNPGIGTSDQKQPGGLHRPTCDGLGSVLTEQTRGPARPWPKRKNRVRSARTTSSRMIWYCQFHESCRGQMISRHGGGATGFLIPTNVSLGHPCIPVSTLESLEPPPSDPATTTTWSLSAASALCSCVVALKLRSLRMHPHLCRFTVF